jgi:hypothetical protein
LESLQHQLPFGSRSPNAALLVHPVDHLGPRRIHALCLSQLDARPPGKNVPLPNNFFSSGWIDGPSKDAFNRPSDYVKDISKFPTYVWHMYASHMWEPTNFQHM